MLYLTFLAVAIHLEPPPLLTIKLIKKVRRQSEDSNLSTIAHRLGCFANITACLTHCEVSFLYIFLFPLSGQSIP